MADDIAIKVENVSKTFKLPHEKTSSIKGAVVNFWRRKKTYEVQQALNNISFEIKKGEFFGIVGRNGSGKSTLLKLLAGIYAPSAGAIHVNGRLTPFIELGVGFNPELTGRENVFLNGALLGFSRKEMLAMYNDIVKFAELERFMDQKLKNYSSGMQVRLAFSIAIRAKSDILVLDEVLAVGDEAFQSKCIDVFEKYKAEKKTVVLVTHDMSIVRRFCSRATLVTDGKISHIGEPREVATKYSTLNNDILEKETARQNEQNDSDIAVQLLEASGKPRASYKPGESMRVLVSWPDELQSIVKNVGIGIVKHSGEYIFGTNTFDLQKIVPSNSSLIEYEVELNLGPGNYRLMLSLFGESEKNIIKYIDAGPSFIVEDSHDNYEGLVRLKHNWLLTKR